MESKWKVIIADDEPIIRDGIREAVDWAALRMEVVAEAEDGEEALELALRHRADVLLVDLNMPIMHGIVLIGYIREQLPQCRVVIVTGHDEFRYAQEAIRLDVDDYILKPANPSQLNKVLKNVQTALEAAKQQEKHLELASRQIVKNLSILRERFCSEWIEGSLSEAEIEEQLRFLQLPAAAPRKIGVIRWAEAQQERPVISEKDRQLYLFAMENMIGELLQPWKHVIVRNQAGLIILCVWGDVPEQQFDEIEQAIRTYLKIGVQVCIEPVDGSLGGVSRAFQTARSNVYRKVQLSPIVRRGRQMIQERYSDPELTLESVAQELIVSPIYLSRLFKQELGMPFVQLLTTTRIQKAIQLLNATDMTIHEIAESVGYQNQHYFSTSFKKVTGVSPNQYRKGELT